jgi:hypothetical protein
MPATTLFPVTASPAMDALYKELTKVRPGRFTNIADALGDGTLTSTIGARAVLQNSQIAGRPAKQVIVLLSDGQSSANFPNPIAAVQGWQPADQIPVYCVGLAQNSAVATSMGQTLGDNLNPPPPPALIAPHGPGVAFESSPEARYYCARDGSTYREYLLNIARNLVRLTQ